MEIFTTRVKTNLDGVLQMTQMIDGIMMTGDNAANQILVEVYRGIDRVTLDPATKIVGYFIRSDGNTLEIDGSIEDNMAKVVIPEAAYQVSGNLSIAVRMFSDPYTAVYRGYYDESNMFIQVTDESQTEGPYGEPIVTKEFEAWNTKIVIATLNCYVQITETDSIIDVYHHIPDVQELLAYIATLDNRREEIEQEESARAIAESQRVAAENVREAAEAQREQQEAARAQTFTTNESARQSTFETNETQRQNDYDAAEAIRDQNEADRQSAFETSQTTRQTTFETAESNRAQTFITNESARQSTFETNETQRQNDYDAAEAVRYQNETDRQQAFQTAETTRNQNEIVRQGNETIRQNHETTRQNQESTRQTNETARETAQAVRNAMIDGMTVEAVDLSPYSAPTATITEVNGHKHISFGLRPGDPFVIVKNFASIAEMEAYSGTDIRVGQFVIITSNTEDPDNAKLYAKTSNGYSFVTDLSGSQGIVGPRGYTGNGISSTVLNPDYTLTVNFTDGESYTTESIRGLQGETGNGIAGVVMTPDYKLKITMTDGTEYTTDRTIRGDDGIDGAKGDTGTGVASVVMNADYTLTVSMTDGTSYTSPSLKGEPGAAGTRFTFDSEDHALTIEYF